MRKFKKVVKWNWEEKEHFNFCYVAFFIAHYFLLLATLIETDWREGLIGISFVPLGIMVFFFISQIIFARVKAEVYWIHLKEEGKVRK